MGLEGAIGHAGKTRRICWIMLICLALPEKHPVRRRRLPWLANELAFHAARAPSSRPN